MLAYAALGAIPAEDRGRTATGIIEGLRPPGFSSLSRDLGGC